VPETVGFATRSQLADDMITAAVAVRVPARWVTADEAYGNNTALRARLRRHRLGYVLAVSCATSCRSTAARPDAVPRLPAWSGLSPRGFVSGVDQVNVGRLQPILASCVLEQTG
jgi:SRSO17 transposase